MEVSKDLRVGAESSKASSCFVSIDSSWNCSGSGGGASGKMGEASVIIRGGDSGSVGGGASGRSGGRESGRLGADPLKLESKLFRSDSLVLGISSMVGATL